MTGTVPGIGGTLLPERYVAAQLLDDAAAIGLPALAPSTARQLAAWWGSVEAALGPTAAIRAVFDRLAMPLCAMLGFAAHDATFNGPACRARLTTRAGTPVALVVTTWAARPSSRWADLARHAREIGAAWGLVVAPPFLSLVPVRGAATRHSLDAALPHALAPESLARLFALLQAGAFDAGRAGAGAAGPSALDRLLRRAERYQDGVRADLQRGVEVALRVLQPVVTPARRAAAGDDRGRAAGHRAPHGPLDETLTLVYRILFLLFVESRRLVPNDAAIYRRSYAISRFCRAAARGAAVGLWDAFAAATRLSRMGCHTEDLRVAPFNGALFARLSAPALEQRRRRQSRDTSARERDEAVRQALVALGSRPGRAGLESINYRDLGVEQLGAVYERVLDLEHDVARPVPPPRRRPASNRRHSHVRKQTGTFYTPQPLADYVVRRTLAPLVDEASSEAILALRIVDPAMGSGAFLVAACHYLAGAYEQALIAEGRLAPTDVDDDVRAMLRRTVAERCLWGVDRNSTAVHLARLSLWLVSLARDKPLGFLDHRLRTGDSLVGAWPGDLRRLAMNRARRSGPLPLFDEAGIGEAMQAAAGPLRSLVERRDDTVADVRAREADWRRLQSSSSPLHRWRMAAHLWCARWFPSSGSGEPAPPDAAELRALIDATVRGDRTLDRALVDARVGNAAAIAADRAFFHWPLEFPDVFYDADGSPRRAPGFDAVIGNPPWEMVRRDDKTSAPAPGDLLHYVRQSGQYPSCDSGHLNLYQAFVDRALALTRPGGRIGLVLPWGLATDDGAGALRRRLLHDADMDAVVGIDNVNGLFPIHRGLRFMALTCTAGRPTRQWRARTGIATADELDALPARSDGSTAFPVTLTPERLRAIGGPALRFPDARRAGDLRWMEALARRFPPLGSPDGWHASFGREVNATTARPFLGEAGVPVIEGKHIAPFVLDGTTARRIEAGRLAELIDPAVIARPRLGYRDVSGVGNRFTLIAAVVPPGVVTTHTVFCLKTMIDLERQHFLCALFNSYVLNAAVRLLMGGHVTTGLVEHLPVPSWRDDVQDREIVALARAQSEQRTDARDVARLQALVAHRFDLTAVEFEHITDGCRLDAHQRSEALRQFAHPDRRRA